MLRMSFKPMRHLRVIAVMGLLLLPACGSDSRRLPTYPVSGRILVGDEPAAGMFIYLWPEDIGKLDAYCPNGQTDEQGNFVLSTYDAKDGAPAGTYTVTFEWPVRFNTLSNQWEGDKLKGKYKDSASSTRKLTIEKKPNVLEPIVLPKTEKGAS